MENQDYTLLVVDDEEMNRDMLSRRLQRKGFSVETAESGERKHRRPRQEKVSPPDRGVHGAIISQPLPSRGDRT